MSYVSVPLRRLVTQRAKEQCEYCRYPQAASFFTFEIEHIIAEKHDGITEAENLALSSNLTFKNVLSNENNSLILENIHYSQIAYPLNHKMQKRSPIRLFLSCFKRSFPSDRKMNRFF